MSVDKYKMDIRKCGIGDCPQLAHMNKHLLEDEQSELKMSETELQARMEFFIATDYDAYVFSVNKETLGYALVNPNQKPYYLRQFFIKRGYRRLGYGRAAFRLLLESLGVTEIDIDCLLINTGGYKFWEQMGFKPRYVSMRFNDGNC